MSSRVSASKSALLLSPCLRWAGEGAREYDDKRTDTSKRDRGIDFHARMDCYYSTCLCDESQSSVWNTGPYDEVEEWADEAVDWSKQFLEPRCESIRTEVYVSSNFATGDVHVDSSVRDRKYPDMPGYTPGTADLVCVLKDGSLLVGDWKTGGGTGADKQLLTLAYGLQRVLLGPTGALRPVRLAVLYAGQSGVLPHEWAVSDEELVSHATAMAFQLADVGTRNEPVPGIHCTQLYCSHLAYCPGITGIVEAQSEAEQALLPTSSLLRRYRMSDSPASSEEAGYTMERITAARRQMKYLEECIRAYAEDGGRVISGEFEFKKTNSGFRWVKNHG